MAHQLHVGDVLLPPEVFLHSRSECTESIVCVHYDVYTTVDQCSKNSYRREGGGGGGEGEGWKEVAMMMMRSFSEC